jgi:hypothetical protein
MQVIRLLVAIGALALSTSSGVNWKTVWLEPNPISLNSPGSSVSYVVKGINGADIEADRTHNPDLKITSSDENVVAVDQASARLTGKAVGRAEIRISFSECASLITATVRDPSENPK